MSGLWVFSVLGVVTILRDEGVKPRVTQHAPSQSGTSPSNRGDQIFSEEIAYYFLSLKFGSEAWVLKKREEQHLEAAQMKFLRHLLGITKLDKEKNQCVREKTGAQSIVKEIKKNTRKSGYNTYRGWTQIDYQNKHYNIDRKDEGTRDDQGRGGGTNFILRIKEQDNTPKPSGT